MSMGDILHSTISIVTLSESMSWVFIAFIAYIEYIANNENIRGTHTHPLGLIILPAGQSISAPYNTNENIEKKLVFADALRIIYYLLNWHCAQCHSWNLIKHCVYLCKHTAHINSLHSSVV